MIVTFPAECTTEALRLTWCYRAQEILRLVHNGMGKWFREGLTENAYNQFPDKIKNRYPYVPQLSKADWIDFQKIIFRKVFDAIDDARFKAKQEAMESNFWNPSLDEDIN
jgi:hypothetical protein